ncbi:MAG TPA: hypothetical protein VF668_02290 [Pyrinomonadaceae bacterium]|jgi:hypothetical protein
MSVVDDLRGQISAGRIIFDAPASKSARLRRELLGQNAGPVKVTESLQRLALELSRHGQIRISDVLRPTGQSNHARGRAFDVGNQEIARTLLPLIATDEVVGEFNIDEIIVDARVAGQADRNHWNYDRGEKHDFNAATLNDHRDHIHFAVKAG